jgi:hypoxanthine phosphoribosyltransferase
MSSLRVLIPAEKIRARIQELGAQIDRDYPTGGPVYLVGVLKGASVFMADLARAMKTPVRMEFVGIASYDGKTSSGEARLTKDLDHPVQGYDVIVVEDIVDTGVTLTYFLQLLQQRKPKSLRIAALLDKPSRRKRQVHVDYVGFEVPDQFLVGYGLDYEEDYRNLPDVCILDG